jgi:hypothetical protein
MADDLLHGWVGDLMDMLSCMAQQMKTMKQVTVKV